MPGDCSSICEGDQPFDKVFEARNVLRRMSKASKDVSKGSKIVERLRRSSERRKTYKIVIYVRGDPVVASPPFQVP